MNFMVTIITRLFVYTLRAKALMLNIEIKEQLLVPVLEHFASRTRLDRGTASPSTLRIAAPAIP